MVDDPCRAQGQELYRLKPEFQARLDAMAEEEGNGDGVKEVQEPAETDRQID